MSYLKIKSSAHEIPKMLHFINLKRLSSLSNSSCCDVHPKFEHAIFKGCTPGIKCLTDGIPILLKQLSLVELTTTAFAQACLKLVSASVHCIYMI